MEDYLNKEIKRVELAINRTINRNKDRGLSVSTSYNDGYLDALRDIKKIIMNT